MEQVVGEILPVALGVAISPMPIIAVILMLLAPHARAASLGFLTGWVVGIAAAVTIISIVIGPVHGDSSSGPSTVVSIIKIVLGVAAVVLGIRQWRGRPRPGQDSTMPKWMAAVDSINLGKAFGLGALLAAVNPKNLTLCLTGGVAIGSGHLTGGETAVVIAIFVVIGSSTVAVPVIANLLARQQVRGPLEEMRDWLTAHNAAVMAVLLLVIGVVVIGKGIAGL